MRHTILLLALALTGCGGSAGADQAGAGGGVADLDLEALINDGVRVEVAEIQSTDTRLTLNLPGEVVGSRDAILAAALGGYVESVKAEEGTAVRKGEALIWIDTSIHAADRDRAEAQAALAASELERVRALGDHASASQLQAAETQAIVTEAGARQARARLSRSVISAPFSGVVAQVGVEPGEVAAPSSPVARVVQLDPITITLSVSDRDVVSLAPGMAASVTANARSGVFPGTVTHVSPAADLRTRAFVAEVEVPNPDGLLLPGMIARVQVQGRPPDGVVIPQNWVVTRLNDQGVFVDEDGTAVWREVQLGDVIHDQVVVDYGLTVGERIVIVGQRDLVDGDALIIAREGTCCADGRAVF